jgi:hypothetical protein
VDEGFDDLAEAQDTAAAMDSLSGDYHRDKVTVHSLSVTPEMKSSVLSEGQPLD